MTSAHEAYHSSDIPQIHSRNWQGDVDLPLVVDLFNRCARLRPHDPSTTLAEMQSDISRPEIDAPQNVRLWEHYGSCVGFAALLMHGSRESIGTSVWWRIAPDAPQAMGALVAKWVALRASELADDTRIPVECHIMIAEDAPECAVAFRNEGFESVRTFVEMVHRSTHRVDHALISQGYTLRSISRVDEWSDWVELRNAAFSGEWRYCPKTKSQAIQFRTSDPSYRPAGDLVAVASDGTMAGLCQCVIRTTEPNGVSGESEGRVALLGVHPAHRRQGLGAALLQSGLDWMHQQGIQRITLGTDAESQSGAIALYESAGFQVVFRKFAYERRFTPRIRALT